MTVIRPAEPEDVEEIFELIKELAAYEKESTAVRSQPADIAKALFGPHPVAFCHVAQARPESGRRIDGYALWSLTFSTWEGVNGIYLEDLFVRATERNAGIGRHLLHELARTAAERGYARVEWNALKWNEPSLGFYKSIGAYPMEEWDTFRLAGKELHAFAQS